MPCSSILAIIVATHIRRAITEARKVGRSACHSCGDLDCFPEPTLGGLQLPVSPALRDLTLSSDIPSKYRYTYMYAKINKQLLKWKT